MLPNHGTCVLPNAGLGILLGWIEYADERQNVTIRKRRHFSPEKKITILGRDLLELQHHLPYSPMSSSEVPNGPVE